MKLVVSDTTPIRILSEIGWVHILPRLYDQVYITPEIDRELNHANTPAVVKQFMSSTPTWLVTASASRPFWNPNLGPGEMSAIALALEMQLPLLMDESPGRSVVIALGLELTGTVGVLETAANEGHIADLAAVHATLRQTKFRISNSILLQSLARHQLVRQAQTDPP